VWDDDAFRDEVAKMIAFLAAQSPRALKTMKSHYLAAEDTSFKQYLELETQDHMTLVTSDDFREAARAFVEKRQPVFK
jgi:2-(1,2-epoxy-1,2-dihydrophenyl)acetyl-CoA isomerase